MPAWRSRPSESTWRQPTTPMSGAECAAARSRCSQSRCEKLEVVVEQHDVVAGRRRGDAGVVAAHETEVGRQREELRRG